MWRSAFQDVIDYYRELKSSPDRLGALDYEQASQSAGTRCHLIVAPSKVDFIVDVDNAARRILNAEELAFYKKYYGNYSAPRPGIYFHHKAQKRAVLAETAGVLMDVPQDDPLNDAVMDKLGKAFIHRQIFPMAKYFQPRDLRGKVKTPQSRRIA